MGVHKSRVTWPRYYRLINSAFPPIHLFDDIADPEDWMLLGSSESKTNPRINKSIGNLDLVPPDRRVGGKGASYVMAPFTHVSPDQLGRFHDGNLGAFYAANEFDTAVIETAYHKGLFFATTQEDPGWLVQMRELIGSIDAELLDLRTGDFPQLLNPQDYAASQKFARQSREDDAEGIVYPSVRDSEGECFAAFYPDVMSIPKQSRHFTYHWNGERVDKIREEGGKCAVYRIDI